MNTLLHRALAVMAIALTMGLWAVEGSAQVGMVPGTSSGGETTEAAPDLSSPEAVDAMVARLSDDEVRALLLDQLNAETTVDGIDPAAVSGFDQLAGLFTAFTTPTIEAVQRLPILFERQGQAFVVFGERYGGFGGVMALFGLIALMIAAGLAAEFAFRKAIAQWRDLDAPADNSSLFSALSYLVRRFLREIMGLIVFYFVARTVGRAVLSPEDLMFAAPFATYLILFPRVGAALSRFILAPNRSNLRLVNVDDHWAAYLHRNIIGLILLGGLTIFVVGFNARNGIAPGETRIGFWLDTAVYIYIAIIAWTAREGLVNMMRGTDPDRTPFDEKVAQAYPYFAIALAAVMFVIVSTMMGLGELAPLLKGAHYTTLFWLLMAPALDTGIRGLVRHLVPPMKGGGPVAEAAYKSTKRSYIKIGRVIVMGIIVVLLANSWNIQLFAAGDRAGIGDNIFGFAMTLVVGYVIYELVGLYINRRLAAEQTSREVTADEAGGEGGGGSGSRLGTVLPLLRVTAQIAIMVVFGLLAIGNLGIDITPLLAGAGILGLAIGFGAQKLVSDVVSGIFFLVDDAFRVGEYVEIGATRGAVEKISIRSMQLRHHRGAVHTIPYGEIPQLTNYSRDWVIMKLRFTVPFDTDPNKIKKIFKKIGAEMKDDPMFAEDFIEPFKSQGVFEFDDVGMVVRGKYMAKPGKQFTIRKEIYNRVKQEFDEAGIDFARREVRVAMPEHEDDHLSSAEETAIKAAAVEAVQQSIRDQEKPA